MQSDGCTNRWQTLVIKVFPNVDHACLKNRPITQNQESKSTLSEDKKKSHQPKNRVQAKEFLLIILFVQQEEECSKDKAQATENAMQECWQKTNHSVEDLFLWMPHQVTLKSNPRRAFQCEKPLKQSNIANRKQGQWNHCSRMQV